MISLLVLPKNISNELLFKSTLSYIKDSGIINIPSILINAEKKVGCRYITIYQNNKPIGSITYLLRDKVLFINRLYIIKTKRIYFKEVLRKLESLFNIKAIFTNADEYTSIIYDKHKIGERI